MDGLFESEALPSENSAGPTIHVINEKPDPNRGFLKLARYRGETAQAGVNAIVFTTHFVELCTEPCGVPIDVSERPILFFVRDGKIVSYPFRINESDEATLSVKPVRQGLWSAGMYLSVLLVGIPMVIVAMPKVSLAKGPPSPGQTFKKLKKAKI